MDPSLLSIGMETGPNQLSASADADHAGADDRRSVSGELKWFLGGKVEQDR